MRKRVIIVTLLILLSLTVIFFVASLGTTVLLGKKDIWGGNKIALIRIEGVILDSKDTIEELKKHGRNPSVKGIVLRIDSPGGAVVPSQEIYEEIKKIRDGGKKTIVTSMGSVAASGGYYIAAGTEKIIANPGSITGSIGVIMELANIEGLLKKIGIEPVVIKSGEHKDIGSMFRGMTEDEKKLLQTLMDDVHNQFIEAVAKGRGLKVEVVRALADGRIFTGRQAKEIGLVDELGNLEDAIKITAKLAKIEGEPKVIERGKKISILDLMKNRFLGGIFSERIPTGIVNLQYILYP